MDLLSLLKKVKQTSAGWSALCPGHPDKSPSLTVGRGDGGRWLVTCHAGCSLDAILLALNLKARDLFPEKNGNTPPSRVEAIYDYDDRYQVVRHHPKSFRQRRPDGNGGWLYNMKGVTPRLYHQNDLKGQPVVLVCEGEKDVDNLWDLDVPATCNSGGALKWRDIHTAQLVEAGVTHLHVIPDADKPGRKHADQVARSCGAAGLTVKVLALPDGVHDLSDWLAAGATKRDLYRLIRQTNTYAPTATPEGEAEDQNDTDVDAPVVVHLADVKPEDIEWVWLRRFARGKLEVDPIGWTADRRC